MKLGYIIENIVIIICFTALSIVFDKWWIILVGTLFLNFERHK